MSLAQGEGSMADDKPYVLGHTEHEIRRLELQAGFLRPPTQRLLRETGLAAGMSVLDIGTGAGDVAMLAAEIVGPGGRVVGIDRNDTVLERARQRARRAGLTHIRFEAADLVDADALGRFDLVVGRFVLIFQPDKPAFLRSAASHVTPGGTLALLETMASDGIHYSTPPAPLYDLGMAKILEGFAVGGAEIDVGRRLVALFREAGLPEPALFGEMPMGGPSSLVPEWMSATLQSLAPALEAAGRLDAMDFTDHSARMREEALRTQSQLFGPPTIGAWLRIG